MSEVDSWTGLTLLLIGYAVFMAVMFYLAVWAYPVRRNNRTFRVKELVDRGGAVTVDGNRVQVHKGALIEVGAASITIHQDGSSTRLTFTWRTPIAVEVY